MFNCSRTNVLTGMWREGIKGKRGVERGRKTKEGRGSRGKVLERPIINHINRWTAVAKI